MTNLEVRRPLRFFLNIILPSIITIVLFVSAFIIFILPEFEHNVMERKREMIRELTNTTWSILQKYQKDVKDNTLTLDKAKKSAAAEIKNLRYGNEKKDYFWITDLKPIMIMHPYRKDLDGKSLANFKDYQGKKMFVEMVSAVKANGEGYVDYMWQWKDDSKHIVPKISYVKLFEPWGWIIGTGIYIQDVKREISTLKNNLLLISIIIIFVSSILLSFIIWQGLAIEKQRVFAEQKLKESREKYKTLLEATTEGIIMLTDNSITFSNCKIQEMTGFSEAEFYELNINTILIADKIQSIDFQEEGIFEMQLKTKNECLFDIIISILPIVYLDKISCVISVKDITESRFLHENSSKSKQINVEDEKSKIIYELQAQNSYNYLTVKEFVKPIIFCKSSASPEEIASELKKKEGKAILVKEQNIVIGIITQNDLINRYLSPKSTNSKHAYEIMTSPIIFISENATVLEAMLLFNQKNIGVLAVQNTDNEYIGFIFYVEMCKNLFHSNEIFFKQIEISESDSELRKIQKKLTVFVNPLILSGINVKNITELTTKVADEITKKIIEKAIAHLGKPPVSFAFIILGSQARCEQTLATDQDNAIIYENPDKEREQEVHQYFLSLGNTICNSLNYSGYAFCKGNIMAKNEKWCQPITAWQHNFQNWIYNYEPQDILEFSIFLDFRYLYGDKKITEDLHQYINNLLVARPAFLFQLAQNLISYKPPLGMFGKILLEHTGSHNETFDIKNAMQPILIFSRIYALHNNLNLINTIERLKSLSEKNVLSAQLTDEMIYSYEFLMQIRFKHQLSQIFNLTPADNHIPLKKLTDMEQSIIKKIFISFSNFFFKAKLDYKGIS